MSTERTLLQAALSHLDLALLNLCEQVQHNQLKADDVDFISESLTRLQQLSLHRCSEAQAQVEGHISNVGFSTVSEQVHGSSKLSDGKELLIDIAKNGGDQKTLVSGIPGVHTGFEANTPTQSMSGSEMNLEMADMLKIMLGAYEDLDKNGLGVARSRLQSLSENIGFHKRRVQDVFRQVDETHDGVIFQEEWKSIAKRILAKHSHSHIIQTIKCARRNKLQGKSIHSRVRPKWQEPRRCVLSFKSPLRTSWDLLIVTLLCYVALALPLTLAFEHVTLLQRIDQVVDWIFFFDLFLNFRTTFEDHHREEIWEPRLIAKKYLQTWFLLDFVSSVPLEQLSSGVVPRMQSFKLLKFGKTAKVTKVLKVGRMFKIWAGSEVLDTCEEFIWSHHLLSVGRGGLLLLKLLLTGHWLACLLLACGGDSAEEYIGNDDMMQQYMAALYWAIMTMTTVGYGDVPMRTDLERLYACVAMIIGGSFYGYVIGVFTTILQRHDMDQRAFTERMDIVLSWLSNHYELPYPLRRQVWRHFKEFLTTTKAIEDSMILNDLPPRLRNDVSVALLSDSVRHNPLFANLSSKALSKLVSLISEVKFQSNEVVVDRGDAGRAMFIIHRGFVHLESEGGNVRYLCAGDSFGEEVLLKDVKDYAYSVRTHSKVHMYKILREDFIVGFKDLHQAVTTMVENAYTDNQDSDAQMRSKVQSTTPGLSSLIAGGPSGVAPSFPNVVLESFNDLVNSVDKLHQGFQQGDRQKGRAKTSMPESTSLAAI